MDEIISTDTRETEPKANEPKQTTSKETAPLQDIAEILPSNDSKRAGNAQLVDVRIRNVSVSVDPSKGSPLRSWDAFRSRFVRGKTIVKEVLRDVSADLPGRSLTAIVGASGSGKTTLLNVLAHRIKDKTFQQIGTVSYQYQSPQEVQASNNQSSKIGMAYVLQQDVLLPTLTVRELLSYAADLRLSTIKTKEQRKAMVESVITELGLEKCADTKIGDDVHKGCSGGEKRRTSIGIQLLADQPVLILDEPTTGLDAASAIQVVKTLKSLADRGKTVIMTIHQPRSEIWQLVDNLILLSRGSPVYSGPVKECLPYFEEHGFVMQAFFNPFDFVIDLAAIDLRSKADEKTSTARVKQLQEAWTKRTILGLDEAEDGAATALSASQSVAKTGNPFTELWNEILVHTRRTFVVTCRDRLGLIASMVESLSMGIMSGWVFYQLSGDLQGIRSRQGAMYSACALQGYLILLFETYRLTIDIEVYDRERIEGVIRPVSFIFSRRLSRLVLEDIPVPLFYAIIFYFMAGFNRDATQFFVFFSLQLLLHLIAVNLATVCVACSRQFMIASLIANVSFTLQTMGSGFFINSQTIAIWLRWIKWTAYTFYAFGALCTNEFEGHFYDCPSPGGPTNPACLEYTGSFILASLGLPQNWLWRPIAVLTAFVLGFFILSGLILQFHTIEVQMAKTHGSDNAYDTENLQLTGPVDESKKLTIVLENFGLDVETKNILSQNVKKQIFNAVDMTFEPGVLNVIMGPSGSGKSSCLNAMARRLYGSATMKYHETGRLLLNGSTASDSVIGSICSYVPQDDTGLLPSLTVRETLHFGARLRLPSWMDQDQKVKRAESVLLQLGLKDCADTLIGNEMVKGISGGEKRRVSIALQILTDPRVLLLDEPTSGLDAFTAFSIIEVLKGLADEGRTIIFSIHQPRSDMFKQFGGVLLLAKGGNVIFAGKGTDMLSHFSKLGYECPEEANPADFALDIVAVDLPNQPQVEGEKIAETKTSETNNLAESISVKISQPEASSSARKAHVSLPAGLGMYARSPLPLVQAFPILVQRGVINLRRQPNLATGRLTQFAGLGIVLAAFFAPLGNNFYSVQSRIGYVQAMSSMFFVGMLNSIAMYPLERDIFYHEERDGTYRLESFFLYYCALELPVEMIASALFSLMTVFAVGLPRTADLYFLTAFAAFCVVNCGESFGIGFLTLFSHTGLAVSVMSVVLSISVHLGGVLSINIDDFLQGINHISPVKWQVGALASKSLRGILFTCGDNQRLANGRCPIETGEQVLELYKMNVDTVAFALALGGVTLGYRLLAYGGLKVRRVNWKDMFQAHKTKKIESETTASQA